MVANVGIHIIVPARIQQQGVVDHLERKKKQKTKKIDISQGATDPFSIARMLLCTHKHGSEMG